MKDPNEIVAVKCEGGFTEWYSPFFKEPFEDNAEYRKYYEEHIIDIQPVIGPSLGEAEDDFLSNDLQCHCERMCVDSTDWDTSTEDYAATIKMCLADGKKRVWEDLHSDQKVTITPYSRKDMPKPNEEHLKVYGPYADLMRERVAAI